MQYYTYYEIADMMFVFIYIYRKHKVKFVWIRGHAGHPENEQCDKMAVAAAMGNNLKTDFGYESEERN